MAEDHAGDEPIRVGVVGTGFAASAHVDAIRRVPGAEVAGVVGSSRERGRAGARRLGVARSYPDVETLLSDRGVDAIHNCTPNHLHAEITLAALAAGKHVLSEKPLGLDSTETGRLIDAATRVGSVTGVCFNYRHFPLVQQVRSMVAGQGRPAHFVHGSYLQDWLLNEDDWNWRLEAAKAGSTRAVADIGSHWVDTVEHVTGDPVVAVMADLGRLHEERLRPVGEAETFGGSAGGGTRIRVDTEDFASVLVRFESGGRGTFCVSQVSPGRKNRLWFQIDTTSTSFAWDQEEPNRVWMGRRDQANAELVRDPSLLDPTVAPLARYPGGHQEGWPDALRNLLVDFYGAVAAIGTGKPYRSTFASFEEAHHVTQVVEAIAESDRTRSWVAVPATAAVPGSAGEGGREIVS